MQNLIKKLNVYSEKLAKAGYLKQASVVADLSIRLTAPAIGKPLQRKDILVKASTLLTDLYNNTEKHKSGAKLARVKYLLDEYIAQEVK